MKPLLWLGVVVLGAGAMAVVVGIVPGRLGRNIADRTVVGRPFEPAMAPGSELGQNSPGNGPVPPNRSDGEPTETDALNAAYLTQYSQRKFAALFTLLPASIPAEKVHRLGELLVEREITLADAKRKAKGEGRAVESYLEAQSQRIRNQIQTECGRDVAELVDGYIRTLPQRVMVGSINQILIYRGVGMTVPQMERLGILINEREVWPTARHPSDGEWARYLADKQAAYHQVIGSAAEFLSPPQLEAVRQELELQIGLLKFQRGVAQLSRGGSGRAESH